MIGTQLLRADNASDTSVTVHILVSTAGARHAHLGECRLQRYYVTSWLPSHPRWPDGARQR